MGGIETYKGHTFKRKKEPGSQAEPWLLKEVSHSEHSMVSDSLICLQPGLKDTCCLKDGSDKVRKGARV